MLAKRAPLADFRRKLRQAIARQKLLAIQAPMIPATVLTLPAADATYALQTTSARAAVPLAAASNALGR